jgi:hypothetical protein
MDGKCLQVSGKKGSAVNVATCTGKPNQVFTFVPSGHTVDDVYTVEQAGLCVNQGMRQAIYHRAENDALTHTASTTVSAGVV